MLGGFREAKLEKEKKAKKEKKKRASLMRATALGTPMSNTFIVSPINCMQYTTVCPREAVTHFIQ